MLDTIDPLFGNVNKSAILTRRMPANKLIYMRYGERLRVARKHAKLNQHQLSENSGVSQPLISQLERSLTAKGSRYTPQLAKACGVSIDWLTSETGPMTAPSSLGEPSAPAYLFEVPPRLRELVELAGRLSEESLTELVGMARMLHTMAEVRRRANPAASSG